MSTVQYLPTLSALHALALTLALSCLALMIDIERQCEEIDEDDTIQQHVHLILI